MKRSTLSDLVDDAAGEEGGCFLAVCVEVERHQSIRPHREVVVHGQNLWRTSSIFCRCTAMCVRANPDTQSLNNNSSASKGEIAS